MRRLHISHIAALAALALGASVPAVIVAAAPASAATTTYTITDLGSLGEGVTHGLAINAAGQVTGDSVLSKEVAVPCPYPQETKCFANPDHAFFWNNGTMTDLGTLGSLFSEGIAINGSGEVVGASGTKNPEPGTVPLPGNDFLWNAKDHKLVALSGMTQVHGINDAGVIVGQCGDVVAPELFACVDNNGTITTLQPCPVAVAINNNGQVLVNCGVLEVFTNGTPTALPTLSGQGATGTAINNLGQVVGTSETTTGAADGVLWSNGTITDLGPNFSPAAINDSGVIVGGDLIYSNGTLQNLNNLIKAGSGYQIQNATGINDNGQIVANASDTATGQTHALLLTPS